MLGENKSDASPLRPVERADAVRIPQSVSVRNDASRRYGRRWSVVGGWSGAERAKGYKLIDPLAYTHALEPMRIPQGIKKKQCLIDRFCNSITVTKSSGSLAKLVFQI